MANAAAALLDQLMGKHRNLDADDRPVQKWSDADVCKHYFIAGFCPHELFTNTKSDMGPCPNQCGSSITRLQLEWDKAPAGEKRPHEQKFARLLRSLVATCDRDIAAMEAKHNVADYVNMSVDDLKIAKDPKVTRMETQINKLADDMERFSEAGLMDEISRCKDEIEELERQKHNVESLAQERVRGDFQKLVDKGKMTNVCEICGAVTSTLDNEDRIRFHFEGKQHLGWQQVRDTLKTLEDKFASHPLTIGAQSSSASSALSALSGSSGGRGDRGDRSPRREHRDGGSDRPNRDDRSSRRDRSPRRDRDRRDRDRRDRDRDRDYRRSDERDSRDRRRRY